MEETFPKFTGLTASLTNKLKVWDAYVEEGQLASNLPEDWERKLDLFDKVLLSRVIMPQKVVSAMSFYI